MSGEPSSRNGRRVVGFVVVSVVGMGVALWLDRPVYDALAGPKLAETDLTRLLRVMGFVPTWLVVATAIGLVERAWCRAGWLAVSVLTCGGVGELLKLVIRRGRPKLAEGAYHFVPWSEFVWDTSRLAMPSSHAMVAFGAAWLLCRWYPRGTPVWLGLAVGCAMTRVLFQAHFVSDVALSAVVSFAVVWALGRWQDRTGAGK